MTRSLALRPTHTRLAWGVATLDLIALLVLVAAVAMEADLSDLIGPLVLGIEIAAYTLWLRIVRDRARAAGS